MSSKNFSVIIPVYNCEKYLKFCLNNLVNQTYADIEIICVNDGSEDNSSEILLSYRKKDNRITVIEQEHQGAASARNAGLRAAKGQYISFIDADDLISQNLYSKLYKIISKTQFDIVMFNAGFYNQKTKCISKENFFKISGIKNYKNEFEEYTYKDFRHLFYGNESVANKVYRREFINQFGFKFKEESNFEDRLFHFSAILHAKKISILNERLYLYRTNRKGSMNDKIFNKNSKIVLEVFDNITDIEELIFTKFPDMKEKLYDFIFIILTYYFMRAPLKIKKEFYKRMRQKIISMRYWNCNTENLNEFKIKIFTQHIMKYNYAGYYLIQLLNSCTNFLSVKLKFN